MKEDSKNDLFEKAPIPRAYFTFALPVVFSMVVSLVYNMVDTFFIAQTGNTDSGPWGMGYRSGGAPPVGGRYPRPHREEILYRQPL